MSRSFREVLYLSPLCLQLREGLHVFPRTPGTGLPKLVHVSASAVFTRFCFQGRQFHFAACAV